MFVIGLGCFLGLLLENRIGFKGFFLGIVVWIEGLVRGWYLFVGKGLALGRFWLFVFSVGESLLNIIRWKKGRKYF